MKCLKMQLPSKKQAPGANNGANAPLCVTRQKKAFGCNYQRSYLKIGVRKRTGDVTVRAVVGVARSVTLKNDRIQDHIYASVARPAFPGIVAIDCVLEPPVLHRYLVFRDHPVEKDVLYCTTSHFGEPFIVSAPADRVGVADEVDVVFLQKVGYGIQPMVEPHDLIVRDII